MPMESAALDRIDRQILHALQLAPRAGFARMSDVLGVSEQTVARRFQRMRTRGLVRVFGRADPARLPGVSLWTLRIGCRPGTTAATADALARRPDTSWVSIGAGGTELSCQVTITDSGAGRDSLLHHLPRAANVLTFTAHQVLHRFVGRGEVDWIAVGYELSALQRAELLADPAGGTGPDGPGTAAGRGMGPDDEGPAAGRGTDPDDKGPTARRNTGPDSDGPTTRAGKEPTTRAEEGPVTRAEKEPVTRAEKEPVTGDAAGRGARVTPEDRPLLAALARDGRASYAALAAATGWSQRQVAQRVMALTASRAVWFDIDAAIEPIGFRAVANLWFTVAPAHLESVGARLADHPELAFAAAMTGSANLMATALCRDAESLYRYLTTSIAAIEEVRTLETVPVLTLVKQAYCLVENGLLKDPAT